MSTILNIPEFGTVSNRPGSVSFHIPISPLAVQSVRRGKFSFYSPPKVKQWKSFVSDHVKARFIWLPYDGPIQVDYAVYAFPFPKTGLDKATRNDIEQGIVFFADRLGDLMDNLNKATIDAMAGIVFTNDKNIVIGGGLRKIYAKEPYIEIGFTDISDIVRVLKRRK